jgi:hypothetical protein
MQMLYFLDGPRPPSKSAWGILGASLFGMWTWIAAAIDCKPYYDACVEHIGVDFLNKLE